MHLHPSTPDLEEEIPIPIWKKCSDFASEQSRELARLGARGKAQRLDDCENIFRDSCCYSHEHFKRREPHWCGLRTCTKGCCRRWTLKTVAEHGHLREIVESRIGYLHQVRVSVACGINRKLFEDLMARLKRVITAVAGAREYGSLVGPTSFHSGVVSLRALVWCAEPLCAQEFQRLWQNAHITVAGVDQEHFGIALVRVLTIELPESEEIRARIEVNTHGLHLTRSSGIFYKQADQQSRPAGGHFRDKPKLRPEHKKRGFERVQHSNTPCRVCGDQWELVTSFWPAECLDRMQREREEDPVHKDPQQEPHDPQKREDPPEPHPPQKEPEEPEQPAA